LAQQYVTFISHIRDHRYCISFIAVNDDNSNQIKIMALDFCMLFMSAAAVHFPCGKTQDSILETPGKWTWGEARETGNPKQETAFLSHPRPPAIMGTGPFRVFGFVFWMQTKLKTQNPKIGTVSWSLQGGRSVLPRTGYVKKPLRVC